MNESRELGALDWLYLGIYITAFGVAAWAILLASPDSWVQRNRFDALALFCVAMAVASVLNLVNASQNGKIWAKTGRIFQEDHPRLYAMHRRLNAVLIPVGLALAVICLRLG